MFLINEQLQEKLASMAIDKKADHIGWIKPSDIRFSAELRALCSQNTCGQYKSSWKGPPAIGPVDQLAKEVHPYKAGLVIQTIGQLEDSFDYPGMMEAKDVHQDTFRAILSSAKQESQVSRLLGLDIGCCNICDPCTYPDQPCLKPEEALASVEAYGINVNALLAMCGLKYNNGANTVSYVGLILIDD